MQNCLWPRTTHNGVSYPPPGCMCFALLQAGLEPTHQVVRLARDAGFDNVHDYLVHLVTGAAAVLLLARWRRWMHAHPCRPAVLQCVQRPCTCGSCCSCSCADHTVRVSLFDAPAPGPPRPAPPVNPAGEDKEVIAARKLAFPWGAWLKEGGGAGDEGGSSEASAQTEGGAKARGSSPLSDDLDRDADKDQVGGAGRRVAPCAHSCCVVWCVLGEPLLQ